jgi:hypothetical protein
MRPDIALLAVTLGWLIIVPPFISVYNTSLHVVQMERRAGIQQELSSALNVILLLASRLGSECTRRNISTVSGMREGRRNDGAHPRRIGIDTCRGEGGADTLIGCERP